MPSASRRLGFVLSTLVIATLVGSTACATPWKIPTDPAASRRIPVFSIPAAKPGAASERFMVIGDWGTGRSDQRKVADAMATRAKRDGLDFILTTGDNFYENGVVSVDDPQWKTTFEDVYADAALRVSIYPSLGNHDHRGSIQAQIDYSRENRRWTMPAAYYTFTRTLADGTIVQFFAIDSNPIRWQEDGFAEQLTWLDGELEKSSARWKIVFGHHPLYSHSVRGYGDVMIARLEPLLTKYQVDLYLAVHDHTLEMHKPVKGVHHVVSGAAGGPDKAYSVAWTDESYYAATLGGFVFIRVDKDALVIEFVRLDGQTQYAHTLTK